MNFLIKLLGGFTRQDITDMYADYIVQIAVLQEKLAKSSRNDTPKDPKTGRFIKVGK